MELFIARHGNTFAAGQKVVWVGRAEDPPLTPEGIEQGRRLGRALAGTGVRPARIYCGPLRRTRQFAELLADELRTGESPVIDPRLTEIDYGRWSGLTNEEIAARFGSQELEAWSTRSRWPAPGTWGSREEEVREAIRGFAREICGGDRAEPVIAVSSNGCMRYFLALVPGEFERRAAQGGVKVGTGCICKLASAGPRFEVAYWNRTPAELLGTA